MCSDNGSSDRLRSPLRKLSRLRVALLFGGLAALLGAFSSSARSDGSTCVPRNQPQRPIFFDDWGQSVSVTHIAANGTNYRWYVRKDNGVHSFQYLDEFWRNGGQSAWDWIDPAYGCCAGGTGWEIYCAAARVGGLSNYLENAAGVGSFPEVNDFPDGRCCVICPVGHEDHDGDNVCSDTDCDDFDPDATTDTDGDGVCDVYDCAPNDPFASIDEDGDGLCAPHGDCPGENDCGEYDCNDSDPNIGSDCDGGGGSAPSACDNHGGDADGDGCCADVDSDDNDPDAATCQGIEICWSRTCTSEGGSGLSEGAYCHRCQDFGGDVDNDGICAMFDADDMDADVFVPGTDTGTGGHSIELIRSQQWKTFQVNGASWADQDSDGYYGQQCFWMTDSSGDWCPCVDADDTDPEVGPIDEVYCTPSAEECAMNGGDRDDDGCCDDFDDDTDDPEIGCEDEGCEGLSGWMEDIYEQLTEKFSLEVEDEDRVRGPVREADTCFSFDFRHFGPAFTWSICIDFAARECSVNNVVSPAASTLLSTVADFVYWSTAIMIWWSVIPHLFRVFRSF